MTESSITRTILETAYDLHHAGIMDSMTWDEFQEFYAPKEKGIKSLEIEALRDSYNKSQDKLAKILKVDHASPGHSPSANKSRNNLTLIEIIK